MEDYEEYDSCMCGGSLDNPAGCHADGHSPTPMSVYYNQPKKESKTMTNYTTAVMLFNPNIRAINIIYDTMEEKPMQESYAFKSLDPTIEIGDLVVIPTDSRHGYTVVKVVDVDIEVDIESDVQLKWIVSRLDKQANDAVLVEEGKWITEMKAAEKRKKREEIKQNMQEMYADGDGNLEAMPIATIATDVLLIESQVVTDEEEETEEEDYT